MAFVHCSSTQSEEASLYNAALSSLCVNTELEKTMLFHKGMVAREQNSLQS